MRLGAGCARAASGHAAAPPSSVMNSRRPWSDIGLVPAFVAALGLGQGQDSMALDGNVLGRELNCSESDLKFGQGQNQ
jgi:hypothetical protein